MSEQPIEPPPAWFLPAIATALAPINERLDRIESRLDRIESRLDKLESEMKLVKAATWERLEEERNLDSVRGVAR